MVVSGFDDVEACSTTLERGASTEPVWKSDAEAVLRHHLRLPSDRVQEAVDLTGQDDYVLSGPPVVDDDGVATVLLERVQVLDALHCSQERSRMAGLAQRLGGTALGWEGLQPPSAV